MKKEISQSEFVDEFDAYNRTDNFSREAREMIYDYLEEINPDSELDVIAVCCDFNEDTVDNIASDYNIDFDEDSDRIEIVRDYLNDNTSVVGETKVGFVFAVF
jgi:hypothetical protein